MSFSIGVSSWVYCMRSRAANLTALCFQTFTRSSGSRSVCPSCTTHTATRASCGRYESIVWKVREHGVEGTRASCARYESIVWKVHVREYRVEGTRASCRRYESIVWKVREHRVAGTRASYRRYESIVWKVSPTRCSRIFHTMLS